MVLIIKLILKILKECHLNKFVPKSDIFLKKTFSRNMKIDDFVLGHYFITKKINYFSIND